MLRRSTLCRAPWWKGPADMLFGKAAKAAKQQATTAFSGAAKQYMKSGGLPEAQRQLARHTARLEMSARKFAEKAKKTFSETKAKPAAGASSSSSSGSGGSASGGAAQAKSLLQRLQAFWEANRARILQFVGANFMMIIFVFQFGAQVWGALAGLTAQYLQHRRMEQNKREHQDRAESTRREREEEAEDASDDVYGGASKLASGGSGSDEERLQRRLARREERRRRQELEQSGLVMHDDTLARREEEQQRRGEAGSGLRAHSQHASPMDALGRAILLRDEDDAVARDLQGGAQAQQREQQPPRQQPPRRRDVPKAVASQSSQASAADASARAAAFESSFFYRIGDDDAAPTSFAQRFDPTHTSYVPQAGAERWGLFRRSGATVSEPQHSGGMRVASPRAAGDVFDFTFAANPPPPANLAVYNFTSGGL